MDQIRYIQHEPNPEFDPLAKGLQGAPPTIAVTKTVDVTDRGPLLMQLQDVAEKYGFRAFALPDDPEACEEGLRRQASLWERTVTIPAADLCILAAALYQTTSGDNPSGWALHDKLRNVIKRRLTPLAVECGLPPDGSPVPVEYTDKDRRWAVPIEDLEETCEETQEERDQFDDALREKPLTVPFAAGAGPDNVIATVEVSSREQHDLAKEIAEAAGTLYAELGEFRVHGRINAAVAVPWMFNELLATRRLRTSIKNVLAGKPQPEYGASIAAPGEQRIDDIRFDVGTREILRLCSNGDIFVHGKLVENDVQAVAAFKEWLAACNAFTKPNPWQEFLSGVTLKHPGATRVVHQALRGVADRSSGAWLMSFIEAERALIRDVVTTYFEGRGWAADLWQSSKQLDGLDDAELLERAGRVPPQDAIGRLVYLLLQQHMEEHDPEHVDAFINNVTHSSSSTATERYAAFWFFLFRTKESYKLAFKEPLALFQLFCMYRGTRYRVTGASRMGDVWLRRDFDASTGYDERVRIGDCSMWSHHRSGTQSPDDIPVSVTWMMSRGAQ